MKKVIQKVPVIRVEISVSPHIWGDILEKEIRKNSSHFQGTHPWTTDLKKIK
jgi:hypothetical protein